MTAILAQRLRESRDMMAARSAIAVAQEWRRRLSAAEWLAVRATCGESLANNRYALARRVRNLRHRSGLYQ